MLDLLFSPGGRISPQEFMKGARILIFGSAFLTVVVWYLYLCSYLDGDWSGFDGSLLFVVWPFAVAGLEGVTMAGGLLFAYENWEPTEEDVAGVFVAGLGTVIYWWCWIVLWAKRYRDSGKSGWMCLFPIVVFLFASTLLPIISLFLFFLLAGDIIVAVLLTLAVGICHFIIRYAVAFSFNRGIRPDPDDNRFGPVG
ncbi:MAG: hypothetical protein GDA35_10235 [Hyphomonadaceae bacterium]|nr:hypothetical protein [Hyphomonadaceae bacterium]